MSDQKFVTFDAAECRRPTPAARMPPEVDSPGKAEEEDASFGMFIAKEIMEQKEFVIEKRRFFFGEIIRHLTAKPSRVEEITGGAAVEAEIDPKRVEIDSENGSMFVPVIWRFEGETYRFAYLFYQGGKVFRVGLVIYDDRLFPALPDMQHEDPVVLWGNVDAIVSSLDNGLPSPVTANDGAMLYDWSFSVPGLYNEWVSQEHFVFGMRHFHLSVLKAFHNFCTKNRHFS